MSKILEKWKNEFVPCLPCIDPIEAKRKDPPYWWLTIIKENGIERYGHSCKDSWGFLSCPNSPANKSHELLLKETEK